MLPEDLTELSAELAEEFAARHGLVQKEVEVRRADGTAFRRKQWVRQDPGQPPDPQSGPKPDAAPDKPATSHDQAVAEARDRLGPELAAKVARGGPRAGGEVDLTKEEVDTILRRGVVGFVSAGRNPADPRDAALDDAAVEQRYADLRAELVRAGYKFAPVRGHYGGEEDSFMVMVPEGSKGDVVELGRRFNQDSVIVSVADRNHMVFTTGPNAGKEHRGSGFEYKPEADDYYSEYCPAGAREPTDCVKFSLRFDFGRLEPKGFSAPGPPPRPGLVWKDKTHRWVRPEEATAAPAPKDPGAEPAAGPRPAPGRKGGSRKGKTAPRLKGKVPSEKAKRARKAHVMIAKDEQDYAEKYAEPRLAKAMKGRALDDNEPVDVVLGSPDNPAGGVELKTVVKMGANDKITMHGYPIVRKVAWEQEHGVPVHTVVFDDRNVFNAKGAGRHDPTKRVILYRRGTGSFRLGGMYRCKDLAELTKLIAMDDAQLPSGARRTDGKWREGRWTPYEDAGGKGYKNTKTGEVVRQRR
jgi:hypothetical protein